MSILTAEPIQLVVPEQTWGLAEALLTFPTGWANEVHHGSTRVAAELFGRGTVDKQSDEIRRELQALSCAIDAGASAFQTRVSLQAHEDKLLDTVELALRLIQRFAIDTSEFERVMARLDSENRSVREDPDLIADLALRRAMWPQDREAFGSAGRLSERHKLTPEHVAERWRSVTNAPPLVLGCATNEQLMRRATDRLTSVTAMSAPTSLAGSGVTPATSSAVHVPSTSGAECLRIARILPPLAERERAIIELLDFALVGGFMGTLYEKLRTELHLVYSVGVHVTYQSDYTLWIAEVSPSPGHSDDVLSALPDAIDFLAEQLNGPAFGELIARFVAHHVHRVSSWRGRFHGIRSDLEQGRPADERRRLPERVSSLSAIEVIAFLRRWNHAQDPRVVIHVGSKPPKSQYWTTMRVSELAPGE